MSMRSRRTSRPQLTVRGTIVIARPEMSTPAKSAVLSVTTAVPPTCRLLQRHHVVVLRLAPELDQGLADADAGADQLGERTGRTIVTIRAPVDGHEIVR